MTKILSEYANHQYIFFLRNRESLLCDMMISSVTYHTVNHLSSVRETHIGIFVHCTQFQGDRVKFDHIKRNC